MDYRDKLIGDLSSTECQRVCADTVKTLQGMTDCLQSGYDSLLVNLWEEIVVQVKDEVSFTWELYRDTVLDIIFFHLDKLPLHSKQAIWLQTDPGIEWDCDEALASDLCPTNIKDISQYIFDNYLIEAAGEYTNDRIEKFLDGPDASLNEDDLQDDDTYAEESTQGTPSFGCDKCCNDDAFTSWKHGRNLTATLVDDPHFSLTITKCPDCNQKFLKVFTEIVDWVDGDDSQYWDLLPLSDDEAAEIERAGKDVSHEYIMEISEDRRHLKRDSHGIRWCSGGLFIMEGY